MSANAQAEVAVGSVLDRYEIVRHVARGGMGSVWLARFSGKHGFTKHVALKTIAPELAAKPEFHAMFLEEARISAKLAHANVAQVLDVGEHAGGVYIVFEWVDGKSLAQICAESEAAKEYIPTPLLLRVLADACAGLHAAHELTDDAGKSLGIVHRDVKPANVLVSDKGFSKLIDFGIAKARDRVHGETRSGFVKGTPHYMSPEQACREPVDRRSDVWSVGAVMFRALAGQPPFEDHIALLEYMDGTTPLGTLRSGVPNDVLAIVLRALHVDPTKRYQTAEEMRHALERALHAQGTSAEQVSVMASRLASTEPGSAAAIDPRASTELVVSPVARTPTKPPGAGNVVPTALSPQGPVKPPAKRDPVKPLMILLAVVAVVALSAIGFAMCSGPA